MSCILRISGENLNIDALLDSVEIKPYKIWHSGEPRSKSRPDGKRSTTSGASFLASDADFSEFDLQVKEVTSFLRKHREDITVMAEHEESEYPLLDFGIELRDVAIHGDFLPLPLLEAAVAARVSILLSHYPCPEGEGDN